MTTIYLIRHAEAEGNLYRRIHGWYDALVTENGLRQIQALEQRFQGEHFDAVWSSDLYRTRATARALYVPKGLSLRTDPELIAVQDGVRPLGTAGMIRRVAAAAALHGAAVPVVEAVDSFRETDGEADAAGRAASHIVDRRLLRIVQTPQIFRAEVLRRAYESEYRAEFTDDASVVEAVGQAVCLAAGERENLKLTTPGDFVIAEALIAAREEAENEEGTTDAEHV